MGSVRKEFSEIFFDEAQKKPFGKTLGKYEKIFTALRSSPSAFNSQPWRILVTDNNFALFDAKQNKYSHKDSAKTSPMGGKYIISFTVDPLFIA